MYYSTLSTEPKKMHNLYLDDSEYTFAVGSEDPQIVKGKEAIFTKMCELYFDEVYVDLGSGSVDAQSSQGENVMIMVTGTFQCKGRLATPFVQTMLLVKEQGSYFIMNDVFRILDKNSLIKSCEKKVRETLKRDSPVKKKTEEKKTTNSSTSGGDESKKVSTNEVAASTKEAKGESSPTDNNSATTSKRKKKKKKSDAKKKESQQAKQQQQEVKQTPAGPKSWKDLLMRNDKTEIKSSVPSSKTTSTSNKKVAVAAKSSGKKDNNDSQPTEMFLGNVSSDTTLEKVTAIYEVFGSVLDVKLLPERKHGYFKFAKAESAKKALKAQANGQIKSSLKIELRKKKSTNKKRRK